ncbi:S8 family serine peptidase [Neobacillus ginsengisoli]|uniref:Thermitase n=1 Tax=Neobacillus ginsengisoli TaxID=904295 RepID=A0ABT9XWF0_9BACI|nr:S8 family serine peptidase [Neobacillus ginsengisoli]MDQ0199839.1 thermitase [Neobacillus ginsengisoli]
MDSSPDKLLVCFHSHVSNQRRLQIHQHIGATLIDKIPELNVHVVSIKPDQMEVSLDRYSAWNEVEYAEPNRIAKATFNPDPNISNDPLFPLQWGQFKIQTPQAWSEISLKVLNSNLSHNREVPSKTKSSVVIAVLDSGIDINHPALSKKIVLNKNFSDSPTVDDLNGHGTHVAGIINAIATNGNWGAVGTFNTVELMNVKVLGDNGQGSFYDTAKGIIYATNNGAKVINMSLSTTKANETIHRAVQYASKKRVVLVASAGNYNTTRKHYPSAFREVISVAATDQNDQRAGFSNYGKSWVDVTAPGVSIWSTLPMHSNSTRRRNYGALSGTSQSSAFVSGLAGLILAITPNTKVNIRYIIESNTDPISGLGTLFRYGRINAFKAAKWVTTQQKRK